VPDVIEIGDYMLAEHKLLMARMQETPAANDEMTVPAKKPAAKAPAKRARARATA
jgi:diacylglycerol O-acyltransferase